MKKILIDASNLHFGGGVQVASSLIYELSKLKPNDFEFIILCSDKVRQSIPHDFDSSFFKNVFIKNRYGMEMDCAELKEISGQCHITFTVFGPQYCKIKSRFKITGFAQPWIAYPNNDVYKKISFFERLRYKFKYYIQRRFFFRDDLLVVEHNAVRSSLIENYRDCPEIAVIENTVSAVFSDPSLREKLAVPEITHDHVIGFLGRNYVHKNLDVFKQINNILRYELNIDAGFLFSLDENEMAELGFDSLSNFYSCGRISNMQCPDFYDAIDIFVFPTLLECFSVAPLEAKMCGVDVLASDRKFITDIYADELEYFDPLDPRDIANKIYIKLTSNTKQGKSIFNCNITARERAIKYCELFRGFL